VIRARGLIILGLIMACLAGNTAWGAPPAVTSARVGHHGDATRFVLDLSATSTFHIFTLENPHRLVIDLPTVDWRLGEKTLAIGNGIIQRLRYGQFKPDTSRIVLDLTVPVAVTNAVILPTASGDAYRLVVDMTPVGAKITPDAVRTQPVAPSAKPALTTGPARDTETNNAPNEQAMARIEPLPPPPRPPDLRKVVVIDPGHGGGDPGAISPNGIFEKHITLKTGFELRRQLEATGRYRAVLTRNSDRFVSLKNRVKIAREAGADLFVSLHADSHANSRVRGASIYTLSDKASDAETAELAKRENKADIVAGPGGGNFHGSESDEFDEEKRRGGPQGSG